MYIVEATKKIYAVSRIISLPLHPNDTGTNPPMTVQRHPTQQDFRYTNLTNLQTAEGLRINHATPE